MAWARSMLGSELRCEGLDSMEEEVEKAMEAQRRARARPRRSIALVLPVAVSPDLEALTMDEGGSNSDPSYLRSAPESDKLSNLFMYHVVN